MRGPEPAPEDARRILETLAARAREFADLRTLADIHVERDGERYHLRGILLLRAPASLRFEALSPLGTPWLVIVIHEGRLTVYDTARHAATVSPATAATARRLLGLPFEPEELVAVLAGQARLPTAARVAWGPGGVDGRALELQGPEEHQRLWIDPVMEVLIRREVVRGRTRVELTYYWMPDGRPSGFDVLSAPGAIRGQVRYRDPVVGAGVEAERFELAIPPGARWEVPERAN